jgi:hypothetical protein
MRFVSNDAIVRGVQRIGPRQTSNSPPYVKKYAVMLISHLTFTNNFTNKSSGLAAMGKGLLIDYGL